MDRTAAFAIVLAVLIAGVPRSALAQGYPTKPIRLLVAQAAGGPTDVVTRIYATKLSELLGQPVVVDNRPGAGGNIAGDVVAHAPPDGYTLCAVANGTVAIAPHFIKLSYAVGKDLAPVALIGNSPLALMVYPGLQATSIKDLIALAKAKPGTINFGSSGQGATGHLAGEMFKMMAGVNLQHVPYRGEPQALSDLMGGQVQVMFATMTGALPLIRAGQLRALAVTSKTRSTIMPDVPPVADFVPGYELRSWAGMAAPRNTPAAVIDLLNEEINAGLMRPGIKAKYDDLGLNTLVISPAEFRTWIADDIQKWARVVKFAGIKPE